MKRTSVLLALAAAAAVSQVLFAADAPVVRRVFRAPVSTRGNVNVLRSQPVDEASWIWMPGDSGMAQLGDLVPGPRPHGGGVMEPVFLKFRREFESTEGTGLLTIDVSADERFYLTVDGVFVSRGPNRSIVENWQYNTYEIRLSPGRHVIEATVWKTGWKGPLAQLSWRGGFVVKADGAYHRQLTTGVAPWKVGRLEGIEPIGIGNDAWGTGDQWQIVGSGIQDAEPRMWVEAQIVRGPAGRTEPCSVRTPGWMLFPSQIPDQLERPILPGRVVAVAKDAPWRGKHVYTQTETREAFDLSRPFTVPANTRLQLAWDLGRYYCAYPQVTLSGGRGARISLCWTESAQRASDGLKGGERGARDAIVGRYLNGFGDVFVSDGRTHGVFTVPWFRCGKWCRIDIETQDEPLTVDSVSLLESRYPLEMEGRFSAPEDPSLADIRRISERTMQMCCHEMLFDCPYYEQQMYPGDTRVQINVLAAMTRDDRIVKRAIELFDLGTRDNGMCPFNFPSRGLQEGVSYTLCYLLMYGDYVMNHADRAWLRARLPGMRKSMSGVELYENAAGLLENTPGWRFIDWVPGWEDGVPAKGCIGPGVNAELNLFWALAMASAAKVERALGNEFQAQYWEDKMAKLKAQIVRTFWCEERGLLADTPERKDFSEHSQCLAIVGDVLPADKRDAAFRRLIADEKLDRCTVYFSYYLFEAFFRMGRGDLFLKRLDLWRAYVEKGLTTTQEAPDQEIPVKLESRSDCHAWGAHPIWYMQAGLAGIRSAAPFFEKVLVAPVPGALTRISARHPHPKGFVEVDLRFSNGVAIGRVFTPVEGTFVYGEQVVPLAVGENTLAPRLVLAGDSTLDDAGLSLGGKSRDPYRSWGTTLQKLMKDGHVVRNYAQSGASTKSFDRSGQWAKVLADVRKGDFVAIEFGHNDQKRSNAEYLRNTWSDPNGLFREIVRRWVGDVRAKGATPILLSPICRGTFDETGRKLIDVEHRSEGVCLGSYRDAMRELSDELKCDYVDMNTLTHDLMERLGREESMKFFVISTGLVFGKDGEPSRDTTHPVAAGALAFAGLFVEDVKSRKLPVAELFR